MVVGLWLIYCGCTLLFFLLPAAGAVQNQNNATICNLSGCNCTKRATWIIANCSFTEDENVEPTSNTLFNEILINGGNLINIKPGTFNSMPALGLVHIKNAKKVLIDSKSFQNLNSTSLLIRIENCDQLIIKTGAFDNLLGYVDAEIINSKYASIEKAAFNRLRMSEFVNIAQLVLAEGTFEFKGQGNQQRHGPTTKIKFDRVTMDKIPPNTFFSSVADITISNSKINLIESMAFFAYEIPAVTLFNTIITRIKAEAFSDHTLITTLKIEKCTIAQLDSNAIRAGIGHLTVTLSNLTDVEAGAFNCTTAMVEFSGNQIQNLRRSSLVFNNWNRIQIEQNLIRNLYANFIEASNGEVINFKFTANEIYNIEQSALSFVPQLGKIVDYYDNYIHQPCHCYIDAWLIKLTNSTNIDKVKATTFCMVDERIAQCYNLTETLMNISKYNLTVCLNETVCKTDEGEEVIIETTTKLWLDHEIDQHNRNWWLILIVTALALIALSIIGTLIILLIRGSKWLKRKGYLRNIHYSSNDHQEENTIVTIDEDTLEIPEELTVDFLHKLSERLDNPETHQEASAMIERLYEMFIVDDSYGANNNRQEEEAHLYEELGNLNLQIPPPPYEEQETNQASNILSTDARSILKLMEEKFNLQLYADEDDEVLLNLNSRSAADLAKVSDYSEPQDAIAIGHLYSELKEKNSSDSLKSNHSKRMALRPLPDKPLNEAGPSTKL